MKKILRVVATFLVSIIMVMGIASCNLTDEQIQIISQNAGLGAAVTWIAYDNPDATVKSIVTNVLTVVRQKASDVEAGFTYTAIIYPEIEAQLSVLVPQAQYRPLVLAASLSTLNGIDLLFAINPSWKINQTLSLKAVNSFCNGVQVGLLLSDRDPIIEQAKAFSTTRAKIMK